MKDLNRRAGFTLIELMITVAIIGILAGVLPPLIHEVIKGRMALAAYSEVGLSARTAMTALGRDVRGASAVVPKYKEFVASERCLILSVPGVASGPRPAPWISDHIVYSVEPEGRRLLKSVFPGPGSMRRATRQVLAANLESLSFSFHPAASGARLVTFSAAFASQAGERRVRRAFASAAALRRSGS